VPEDLRGDRLQPRGIGAGHGPTGSGKSTTLAAMVNHKNEPSTATSSPSRTDRVRPRVEEMPHQPAEVAAHASRSPTR